MTSTHGDNGEAPPAPLRSLDFQVVAEAERVRHVRSEVRTALLAHGVVGKTVDGLELGLDEVLMNALGHAEAGEDHRVELHIELYTDRVDIEVRDRGAGEFAHGARDTSLPGEDAESGRGLFLIHHTMDEVSFHAREGGGTLVRMTKRL